MEAIINTARGPAADTLALIEAPKPEPGHGEVLVALKTSGVNPSDVKLRSGAQGPMVSERVIVHNDGSGIIEGVGEGVSDARIGQRVWLYNVNRSADGLGQGERGTAAEYVCVADALAPELPAEATFELGATLGVPAMTAHRALAWAGPVSDKTVLVTGGAGAVGHAAIQIARAQGAARIVATVSSDVKAEAAKAAGATDVINYRMGDLETQLLDLVGPSGVDHAVDVDLAAHLPLYPKLLKIGGTVGSYASASDLTPALPFYPMAFRNAAIMPAFVYSMPDAAKQAAIEDINALLRSGNYQAHIAQVAPLSGAAAAHEAVEGGDLVGNMVLSV